MLLQARETAESLGVSPSLAESVLRLLIRGSLTAQERIRVAAGGRGQRRTALVIGGAGKMGRWFSDFLTSQGYAVAVADPQVATDWQHDSTLDQDLIVVATPLQIADGILHELAARRREARSSTSVRSRRRCAPESRRSGGWMQRHVGASDVRSGYRAAVRPPRDFHRRRLSAGDGQARELFASTMVEQVVMTLDEHDRLIAYVLGLSHALNIAFFTALAAAAKPRRAWRSCRARRTTRRSTSQPRWPAKVRNSISRSSISTSMDASRCRPCAEP